MTFERKALGRAGEAAAAHYLMQKGYKVIFRNYRTRLGEVDLICEWNSFIVFVEVRSKQSLRFGTGAESVIRRKQNRIRQAAMLFLSQRGWQDRQIRFDVIDVYFSPEPRILHIENAF